MVIKSRKFALSLFAGAVVGIILVIFLRPACWATFFGVLTASYLAGALTPKEGAIVGAMVMIPIGVAPTLVTIMQVGMDQDGDLLTIIYSVLLGMAIISGIGAVTGLVVGKILQTTKDKVWFV